MATPAGIEPRPAAALAVDRGKILSIQMLRGLAILMVACWHLRLTGIDSAALAVPAPLRVGFGGVDIFFAISGYVCSLVAARPGLTPGTFLARRAARVLPFNILFSLPYLALMLLVPRLGHGRPDLVYVVSSFFCLPDPLLVAGEDPRPLIPSGWSLQNELIFYVLLALLLHRRRAVLVGVLLGLFLGGCAIHVGWFEVAGVRINELKLFSLYHIEFLAGVLVYLARARIGPSHLLPALAVALVALATTGAILVALGPADGSVPVTPFGWFGLFRALGFALAGAALLTAGLAAEPWFRQRSTIMPVAAAIAIGEASYIFYLIHEAVFGAFGILHGRLGALPGGVVVGAGVPILLTLAVALVFHRWFERPIVRWLEARLAPLPGERAQA